MSGVRHPPAKDATDHVTENAAGSARSAMSVPVFPFTLVNISPFVTDLRCLHLPVCLLPEAYLRTTGLFETADRR